MYKAFNTFIDDLFAFIITMPTAHRVACFRDDVVFLIYLYQRYGKNDFLSIIMSHWSKNKIIWTCTLIISSFSRYLYPVDKNRIDMSGMIEESPDDKDNMSKKVPSVIENEPTGMVTRRRAKKE